MLDLYCLRGRDQLLENKGSMANRTPVIDQSNFSIYLVYTVSQCLFCVCCGNIANQQQWHSIYNVLPLLFAKSV